MKNKEVLDEKNVDTENKEVTELKERIKELENQLREFENYARRLKAQFENYKMEAAKEKEMISVSATGRIVEKFIPVLDDFKRAFSGAEDSVKESVFYKGIEIIYKNFKKALESLGLKQIEVGEKFDPFEHEAVEKIEDEEKEEYTVLEVVEDGYKFLDRVVKPAKVKVSVKPRR
ncbi:nucleotide exchange factor GrpE [Thermosipho ferrireducens]|uniref:Protein GrpE n=1 Tax=Thermosipho ferrireducens TaxID=2571116 RepID=A0ABX7S9K0_9BACT|nr:nucleotide exchange factor GrpE [Thermosipho ferrireducens]QTA38969.1 nucleotide exchange factor GrpE [Thermosipho ferrireducens]